MAGSIPTWLTWLPLPPLPRTPGATGCGLTGRPCFNGQTWPAVTKNVTKNGLSALGPANFGAGLRPFSEKRYIANIYIYIEMSVCVWHWMAICHHRQSFIHVHENSFSFISLRHLRRRNNRCWCCNYGCLFNLVLVHLFLETRLRGSLGRCSLCRSVSQSSHASSRGSGFETHLFQALLLCSCFCSHHHDHHDHETAQMHGIHKS